jgi:ABC-type transport system involved in multi-copper enzyme maturation permease subunit
VNVLPQDMAMVKRLVLKDWQVYQKQLAGYVAGLLLALSLMGMAKPWSFSAGALLLVVLMVTLGSYAVQTLLVTERKEQTVPFIMSLPVTPLDFYWGKLLGNLAVYGVPFVLVAGGSTALILLTELPDGLLVYAWLVFTFMLATYCVQLCVAIVVESEGWITFTLLALMTLLGPYMYAAMRLPGVAEHLRGDAVVFSPVAVAVLAAQGLLVVAVIAATSVAHYRKTSFL